jgi:flavodoxin
MEAANKKTEEVEDNFAGLISPSTYTFEDLSQSEFYHFLLKCTDGLFKGKFFYINTSSEGETIGGGDYNSLTLHIEKAELSDKHCSIKFTPQFKYILNDLNSTDGTWVKIFDLNLLTENKERIYRVSDYEFVFRECSDSDSSGKLSRHEDSKSHKSRSSDGVKPMKMIIRHRKDKTNQKSIRITGEKSLVFGSSSKADYQLEGDKIADFHFEVTKNFLLRNLNHNISESYGLYKCLFPDENYVIRPGHGIRVGNLEFHVERFNTGIVSDKGGRPYLEDCYA